MGFVFRGGMLLRTAIALGAISMAAHAIPVRYNLTGIQLNDGGTITGGFTFDADAGTPCSTGASPCGIYSNVNIVTTNGTSRTGASYTFVCGQVPTCTGVPPDSTEVLFLTTNAANQTGLPALAIFFTGVGQVPPAGLSDAGGTLDVSNSSFSVGAVQEASCGNAGCATPAAPSRVSTAGSAVGSVSAGTIPTLSEWGEIVFTALLLFYAWRRMRSMPVSA